MPPTTATSTGGDRLRAEVTGTNPVTITAYINDNQVMSVQDSGQAAVLGPWTTGSPGIGFFDNTWESADGATLDSRVSRRMIDCEGPDGCSASLA